MTAKRVVVTGLGAITPIGIGWENFWESLKSGQNGITCITRFDPATFSCHIAGEVKNFVPTDFLDKKDARRLDRFIQFAVAASRLALKDAGLNIDPASALAEDFGVVIGSGIGGLDFLEEQARTLFEKGPDRVSPFTVPLMITNMAAGIVAMTFGAKGPNTCVVTACATGTNSIGDAFRLIQRGDAKIMLAGGTEAAITPLGVCGFAAARALSTNNENPAKASRPFDLKRDGFVMGEGAGVVVLEELEFARERGAKIYAEVVGYGMSCDAHHMTAPSPGGEGAVRAMKNALRDANLKPEDIQYVNAHGTSTELNDKYESIALKTFFGEHAKKLAVSSTKSMVGHLLGAAGGVEFIALALSLHDNFVHPTINYEFPDPACDLDYVPNTGRCLEVNAAISNSFGFGGHNAILVAKKFKQ